MSQDGMFGLLKLIGVVLCLQYASNSIGNTVENASMCIEARTSTSPT